MLGRLVLLGLCGALDTLAAQVGGVEGITQILPPPSMLGAGS